MMASDLIRRVAMVALAACVVVGWSDVAARSQSSEPAPSVSPSTPPTTSDDVVLRMETMGGFAPFPRELSTVPIFTLYADGLAVWRAQQQADTNGLPVAQLREATLDSATSESLVHMALARGGLGSARSAYHRGDVADAPATVFTVNTPGVSKRVSVDALGIGKPPRDQAAYRAFEELAVVLGDFDSYLPDSTVVSTYAPSSYLGVFTEDDPTRPDLVAWPWTDLEPDDLVPLPQAPFYRVAVMTPDQLEVISNEADASTYGVVIATLDGRAFRLTVWPLLPDEAPLPIAR